MNDVFRYGEYITIEKNEANIITINDYFNDFVCRIKEEYIENLIKYLEEIGNYYPDDLTFEIHDEDIDDYNNGALMYSDKKLDYELEYLEFGNWLVLGRSLQIKKALDMFYQKNNIKSLKDLIVEYRKVRKNNVYKS